MSIDDVRANILGEGAVIQTPYGERRLTYTDYAASGRAYRPIEDFIQTQVLPFYANTHTETTATGAQTTAFREEARQIVRGATNCTDEDAVIFVGSGVTGAIHTLIGCLGLAIPCCVKDRLGGVVDRLMSIDRPVVFIGPFEHHSNHLPWFECSVDVVVVSDCDTDGIDLDDLQAKLAQYAGRRLIGSFSAGSNVTGRLTNVKAVADALHEAGGVVFFDYAAAGPYVDLDMSCCDAIFLSMHKFVGGPGSPGVLVAKRALFQNSVPSQPGGGTVAFVSPDRHTYLQDVEHREEGGTPNIVGSIRAGLAMKLKMTVTPSTILAHEQDFAAQTIAAFRDISNVAVLGSTTEPRLGIVSFLVTATDAAGVTKALHHNFVVALLNDLFGIQSRGGNSCAAPYAHRLLGVSDADEQAIEACVEQGLHGCKPGWTRLSYGWYDSDATLAFVLQAVHFIADYGVAFLADYTFNPASGSWTHVTARRPLATLDTPPTVPATLPESVRPGYLDQAIVLASAVRQPTAPQPTPFEGLRWFWLPGEIS